MDKIKLGKTDLMLTRIGFGGIPIQRLSEEDAISLIEYGFNSGINWFDTANAYGCSEERFGKALKKFKNKDIYVVSKAQGKELDIFRQQCEQSFQKLQVDYIDLYQFHFVPNINVWNNMKKNGTVDYLLELKSKGRIGHIGASAHTRRAALSLLEQPEIETIQFPFNFLMMEETEEILRKCQKANKGFIAMKPFGGGVLKEARYCIGFISQYQVVTNPGFEKMEEIDEVVSIASSKTALTEEEKQNFKKLVCEFGADYCRRCAYCMPCPQGLQIPMLMHLDSQTARFSPEKLRGAWPLRKSIEDLNNCTGCRQCELKCPYKLPIIKKMKESAGKFNKYIGNKEIAN